MDGSVLLLAMPAQKPVQVMRGHSDSIVDMAFSPDGTLLATAGRDSTGRVWNVEARSG
jgi:WD40 repeat protein